MDIKVFLKNLGNIHHRLMAGYIRKRGWVAFYLEPKQRHCNGMCWLKLYEDEQKRNK
ncbi:hypothetical protein LCGC14_1684030 [marine sediment metagenome]|uniref:Uncharacterized protein n=1 Tax=marine sediment metagenome TaxID=412755 RepID=A0A0F9HMX4_9ZZZZ